MSVDLPPDVWAAIEQHITSGSFNSPDEVLREALAALCARDEELIAIQQGIDDMEAARTASVCEFDPDFCERNSFPPAAG